MVVGGRGLRNLIWLTALTINFTAAAQDVTVKDGVFTEAQVSSGQVV